MMQNKRSFRSILAILLTVALLVSLTSVVFAADAGQKQITILGTSDMHGNIWGYSYEDNKETTNNGMARVYTYIQEVRKENPNTILVDGGDTIQGTILTDDIYNKQSGEHPVITAMNYMGYDAMTLGNHEFNFGLSLISRIKSQAKFPILAANATNKSDGKLLTGAAYTIVERDGVKVAIIGVTNPNIPTWDGDKVASVKFAALSSTVKSCIKEIGDKADIIMVSCHAGLTGEFDEEGGTDAAAQILKDNPEVDVLQVGHYHITVSEKDGKTVVGGVRNSARDVARFDLTVDSNGDVVDSKVSTVDMANYTPSEEIRSLPIVKAAHEKTIAFIKGGSGANGSSGGIFGSASETFQPVNEISGIPAGKLMDTAVMDLINKVQLENSGADVSAAALFKDTSDIKKGTINYGDIFNIYKFDNTLYRVKVTGKELKAYMEWSAACYNQWKDGDLSISFNPEKPGYLYDMFAGVNYEIDLSQPEGSRIKNVTFKGQPLKDDQILTLAVNNYRYSSALKQYKLVSATKEWESPNSIRDMLVQYIKKNGTIKPTVDNNWKITGVDLQTSNPDRATLISLVNRGLLAVPYNTSLNVSDVAKDKALLNNVSVNGTVSAIAEYKTADGVCYYRLRDLAAVLKDTAAAFNVDWNKGVVVTNGTAYTAAITAVPSTAVYNMSKITATVDGKPVSLDTLVAAGNNYITAEQLTGLVGGKLTAVQADSLLTITVQ